MCYLFALRAHHYATSDLSGSFDPLTNGHLDIIRRSSPLFDEIVIAMLNNPEKSPMFSVDERCEMIRDILPSATMDGCTTRRSTAFPGSRPILPVTNDAAAIIRGIRAIGDYEYELRMVADESPSAATDRNSIFDRRRRIFVCVLYADEAGI